jgi:hypothetical protein
LLIERLAINVRPNKGPEMFTPTIVLAFGSCAVCAIAGGFVGYWAGVADTLKRMGREFIEVRSRLYTGESL